MKKNNTCSQSPKQRTKSGKKKGGSKGMEVTIGMDLGDKTSRYCVLDSKGEVLFERSTATTKKGMARAFGAMGRARIAIEVGAHSPWVSRLLKSLGHEVIVANARRVRLICESNSKDDRLDAKTLGRLARVDPELLSPIRHRSEEAQGHLMVIRVRATLVEARTQLVNAARGLAKAFGERLEGCDTDQMGVERLKDQPSALQKALRPLLTEVESLTERIQECNRTIEQIARTQYPETARLRQVSGVGELIALAFVLTIEDPQRFQRSRDVGGYIGLRPKRRDSGHSQPQLRITKEGDPYLRQLLVQGAHYILGPFGPDTDLRRWGRQLAARGGKNAKKRAIVAVARKLAILLHRLWVTGQVYEPLRHSQGDPAAQPAAA